MVLMRWILSPNRGISRERDPGMKDSCPSHLQPLFRDGEARAAALWFVLWTLLDPIHGDLLSWPEPTRGSRVDKGGWECGGECGQ